MIKKKVGGKDVLESGSIFTYSSEPIIFKFFDDNVSDTEEAISITIKFLTDTEASGQDMRPVLISNTELEIKLVNFKSAIGEWPGVSKPQTIGNYKGRKLSLIYRVNVVNDTYDFHYTWLLGEGQENNE